MAANAALDARAENACGLARMAANADELLDSAAIAWVLAASAWKA